MREGLVSCIVPAFNSAAHLPAALGSIVEQTYRPLEAIVVDDGSDDETAEIAQGWGDPVRLVRQRTAGPAATRNRGIAASRGEFVAFLDPDDLWQPEKLALQVGVLRSRPDLDACVSHARMFWDPALEPELERRREHVRMGPIPGYSTTTLLARHRTFERVGTLDPGLWYADAVEWFLRARERGVRVELLPDVLTLHRLHVGNLTRRRPQASEDEFLDLVMSVIARRRERQAS
jgi:glycosyltransferase involved in cell wall biosynthesis